MKITITPDGEVHIETNGASPGEIASMILLMQREMRSSTEEVIAENRPVTLNDVQGATYDWMVKRKSIDLCPKCVRDFEQFMEVGA